jgi:hypothetical protein
VVRDKPSVTWFDLDWDDSSIAAVRQLIKRYAFLDGYAFDDDCAGTATSVSIAG